MKGSKTLFILPICWVITTTLLLTIPGKAFPKENWLDKLWVDKWVHIGIFALMVWLWCRAIPSLTADKNRLKNTFVFLAIFWFGYGVAMEFVQRDLVANRGFDIWDIVADGIGVLAGLVYSWRRYIKN